MLGKIDISHVPQHIHSGRGVGQGGSCPRHLKSQTGRSAKAVVVGFGAAAARLNTAHSAERVM